MSRIFTSFSVRSFMSREIESDCLSKLLISFVIVFSLSYKFFNFESYSLSAETDVPEVEIICCSLSLKETRARSAFSFSFVSVRDSTSSSCFS